MRFSNTKDYKPILSCIYKHKFKFLLEFIAAISINGISLLYPDLIASIIGSITNTFEYQKFIELCITYAVLFLFQQLILATFYNFNWSNIMTSFVFDLRLLIFNKVLHMRGEELVYLQSGDIIERMNKDTEDVVDIILFGLFTLISGALGSMVAVFFLFRYNLYLGIIIGLLAPTVAYLSLYYRNKLHKVNRGILEKEGELSSFLFDTVKNLQEIKTLHAAGTVLDFFLGKNKIINDLYKENNKVICFSERINSFIILIAQILLFSVCAVLIKNHSITIGVMIAALAYFDILVSNLVTINSVVVNSGKQFASIERLSSIMNVKEENYNSTGYQSASMDKCIEFNEVNFQYKSGEQNFNSINFKVKSGESIALIGPSGSGKTTIVNLIYKIFEVQNGSIKVDGVEIEEWNLKSLRSQIGIVYQEPILYYGETLRYNLTFSGDQKDDERLRKILSQVGLNNYYNSLEAGLNTIIGADGAGMSIGEKQRLAIGRVLYNDPPIMMFDEVTSNLDVENQELIKNTIKLYGQSKIIILITHQMSLIEICDKVGILENGKMELYNRSDLEQAINLSRKIVALNLGNG